MAVQMKKCVGCLHDLPREDSFYRAGKWWQSKCKPCHNRARMRYKRTDKYTCKNRTTGFQKLPFETQVAIIRSIKDGMKLLPLSRKHGVNYNTLRSWDKKGQIKIDVVKPIKEVHVHVYNPNAPKDEHN